MSVRRHLLIFALALLACTLALLPARLALTWAEARLAPLRFEGPSGTPWAGQARALRVGAVTLGPVRWRFAPELLLEGRLGADLRLTGTAVGHIQLSLDSEGLTHLNAHGVRMPLRPLLADELLAYEPEGVIDLGPLSARFTSGRIDALKGEVRWVGAALTRPEYLDLGTVRGEITQDEDALLLTLTDGGATAISGIMRVNGRDDLAFDGLIDTSKTNKAWASRLPVIDARNHARVQFTARQTDTTQ